MWFTSFKYHVGHLCVTGTTSTQPSEVEEKEGAMTMCYCVSRVTVSVTFFPSKSPRESLKSEHGLFHTNKCHSSTGRRTAETPESASCPNPC